MGLSSNQARFLALTSRQIDLEHRIQQICQRRLRLTSELENVATSYNNKISNRKMFTPTTSGIQSLSMDGLKQLGYTVINATTKKIVDAPIKPIAQMSESAALTAGYKVIHNTTELISNLNGGAATVGQKYILGGDIDLSSLGPQSNSIIQNTFQGTFDGNGYVIKGLNLSTSSTLTNLGFFSQLNGATIKNVAIEDANISAANSNVVGILAGYANNTTIDNTYSSGTILGHNNVGGLVGNIDNSSVSYTFSSANVSCDPPGGDYAGGLFSYMGATTTSNSYATGDVSGRFNVGGLTGSNNGGTIDSCYASGDVTALQNNAGGLAGGVWATGQVKNSYATGDVTTTTSLGVGNTGGLVGIAAGSGVGVSITNSYATGAVSSPLATIGGFVGKISAPVSIGSSNFYQNNMSGDAAGSSAVKGVSTGGWSTGVWDLSGPLPKLNTLESSSMNSDKLEEGLRNGTYSLAKPADEYSQDPITLNGEQYQEVDWRSTPEIYDELNKGDDVDAENKYDKTVEEINAQDKKLQLEQTSIEVEYKAITSERESVKKILDTNAQSSFKYFS